MRRAIVMLMIMAVAGTAIAQDLGNSRELPVKNTPIVTYEPPAVPKQGGDTIFNATFIAGLPYSNTGTTSGYIDDYDEICPYQGSTSPDVVYRFTPDSNVLIDVDLCGSDYDTKTYIYDVDLNVIACNDDYYGGDPCGVYVSKIEDAPLLGGNTYFIVIDGYGGDYGDYSMLVEGTGTNPCMIDCPPGGVAEGEPPLGDGYEDFYNGGCNSPEFGNPFQFIQGQDFEHVDFCGVSGWYNSGFRDTDWFRVLAGETGVIEISIDAEQPTKLYELGPQDCGSVSILQSVTAGPCLPGQMTITGYDPGEPVWIWVGPVSYYPPSGFIGNEFNYVMTIDGIVGGDPLPDTLIFVDADATGAGDGSSWVDAFTELRDALAMAANSPAITDIWVANGTYTPTGGTDRTFMFELQDNLALYGGFAGGEITLGERDLSTNVTILSGDIGIPGDSTDNSHHVVGALWLESTSVLDGFVVRDGRADGGAYFENGGGLYILSCSPTVANVLFLENFAVDFGGGVYSENGSPTFTNVLISGNTARVGGGMCLLSEGESPQFLNSTFFGNTAVDVAGGLYNGDASTVITNTIFWGNSASAIDEILNSGLLTISYSLVAGCGGSGAGWDPAFGTDGGHNIDADPQFVDAPGGNLRLSLISPAIDAGDSSVENLPDTDLDSNPRIHGVTVDMGPYEWQGAGGVPHWNDIAQGIVADAGVGQGVAWCDFDRDGDEDLLFLRNEDSAVLVANDGTGVLTQQIAICEETALLGPSASWGDYDGDGWPDLVLANFGNPPVIAHNLGNGAFECVGPDVPVFPNLAPYPGAWVDFDLDGALDLAVANYFDSGLGLGFQIYDGDEGFNVSTPPDLDLTGNFQAMHWADLDADGDLDLILVTEGTASYAYENVGGGTFYPHLLSVKIGDQGVDVGDYDNDGLPDIYISHWGNGDELIRNLGNWQFEIQSDVGIIHTGFGQSCIWADYDNDGWLDLFVAKYNEEDVLHLNLGNGHFEKVNDWAIAAVRSSVGAACADIDDDGDLDLYVTNETGPNVLLENNFAPEENSWVKFRLVDTNLDMGVPLNSLALGAKVHVFVGEDVMYRHISGSNGLVSQNSSVVHFGLGAATLVDSVHVYWPTAINHMYKQVLYDVDVNTTHIVALESPPADVPNAGNTSAYALYDAVPNPFNPVTKISFDVPGSIGVRLHIYDVSGRLMRHLSSGQVFESGHHELIWNGRDDSGRTVSAGVYFYRLEAGGYIETKRMMLIK